MTAIDMSAFIAAKSDQLNADDLMDAPRTITITKVTAQPDAAEQPVSIHYEGGEGRPWKPCKTMRRILVGVWGKDASKYVGRSLTLYRDPTVAFGGLQVGGIRISHMSDITEDKTVALLVTRGRKDPFKIKPLERQQRQAPVADDDEQALALKAITEAAQQGTEALSNAWRQKWMAPHRDALALELERLKAIAAANDKPAPTLADQLEDTPGEKKAAEVKAALESATDAEQVESIIAEAENHRDAFDDATLISLETAYSKARGRVAETAK